MTAASYIVEVYTKRHELTLIFRIFLDSDLLEQANNGTIVSKHHVKFGKCLEISDYQWEVENQTKLPDCYIMQTVNI